MSAGILFFNHGVRHIARLVVAIHSLRKHWCGEVFVLHTGDPDSAPILKQIDDDRRLGVSLRRFNMQQLRRNSCYVAKSGLWRHSPFDVSLLVDSDTMFLRSPQPLLDLVADREKPGFLVTAFSDWVTNGKTIGGRLRKWHNVKCDGMNVQAMEIESLLKPLPAVNTGVVGWRDDRESLQTLRAWWDLTTAGQRNPFTDELAAQLLIRHYPHQLVAETWNSSVLYAKDRENAAILHMHGGKHLRPEAGGRWEAEYRECCAAGIAGIEKWGPATDSRLIGLC